MDAYSTLFRLRLKNSVCRHAEERPFHATVNILRQSRDVKELGGLISQYDSDWIASFLFFESNQQPAPTRLVRQTTGGFYTTC